MLLGGRWYDVTVLNVHAPTEGKRDGCLLQEL
jgi:hypothetical protein